MNQTKEKTLVYPQIIDESYSAFIIKKDLEELELKELPENESSDESSDESSENNAVYENKLFVVPENKSFVETKSPVETKSFDASDEKFWNIITKLAWCNCDEKKMDITNVNTSLLRVEIIYLKTHIQTLAQHIEDSVRTLDIFTNSNNDQIKNFTYHIIGLGSNYYFETISDPRFVLFIWCNEPPLYQNLYSILNSIN